MTDRDNYQRVGVEVDEQSFAQLNQRTTDAATSLHRLTQVNQSIADTANQAGSRLQSAFQAVKSNIDKDVNSLKDLRAELSGAANDVQEVSQKSGGGFGVEGLRRVGGAVNQLLPDSDIGPAIQRLGDVGQVVKEAGVAAEAANVSISATSVAIGGLEVATGPLIVVLGAAAAVVGVVALAQKNYNDQLKAGQDLLNNALDAQREYYTDVNTLTTEQAQDRLKVLKAQQQTEKDIAAENQAAIINAAKQVYEGNLKSQLENLQNPEDQIKLIRSVSDTDERFKQLFAAMDKSNTAADKFDQSITRVQQGLDKGAFSANDAAKGLAAVAGELQDTGAKAAAEELKKLNDSVQEAQKAAQEMAQKQVDIVHKYNEAVQSAEDAAAQARINAATKLSDALVSAAQKAVDDANKALEQLEQKRKDNLLSLQRDEEKASREANDKLYEEQITAQRQERDDLQTHLQNLKQIRDRDASRERDDLLNRNYRDLFALKEQKAQDIGNENDRYSQQQQQRQQALQDQQQDEARAFDIQRRERLIAYQQANQDALRQYNIELATAQEAKVKAIQLAQQSYQKELRLISQGETDKLRLMREGYINELKLATQTVQARQAIFQAELNQARQALGQSTAPAFNSPQAISAATSNAEGGVNPAYRPVKVNDRYGGQRESVNGMLLPRGLGLFIPMTNASINPGAGGGNTSEVYNNTFNIVSHDPVGVRQEVINVMNTVKGRRRN